MRVPYRDLVQRASGFEPDMARATEAAAKSTCCLAPVSLRLVGRIASYANSIGLDSLEVAKAAASVVALEPDIRHSVIVHMGESGPADASVAEPDVSTDLEVIATVACTPSAFLGACVPQAATVTLLRSMSNRSLKQPWNSEWFRKEAYRLVSIAGAPSDRDVARNAIAARVDTLWSGMAAECVYSMLREGQAQIGERLWIESATADLNGWMYESLLDKLRSMPWLRAEIFSQLQYRGIADFAESLNTNGEWTATVFDGEDLLEISSAPSVLVDWFASFAIMAAAKPFHDNNNGRWVFPFVSAREGVGILLLSAALRERPDAILRGLHLPGAEWARRGDCHVYREDDGSRTIEVDGERVPVMGLSGRQATEKSVFYTYNEVGERTAWWHIAEDGEEERGQ